MEINEIEIIESIEAKVLSANDKAISTGRGSPYSIIEAELAALKMPQYYQELMLWLCGELRRHCNMAIEIKHG